MNTSIALPRLRHVWRNVEIGWIVAGGGFLALAILWPEQLGPSFSFTLNSIATIAVYLFIAVSLTAYVKASDAENLIGRIFQGHLTSSIFIAAVFGVMRIRGFVVYLAVSVLGSISLGAIYGTLLTW